MAGECITLTILRLVSSSNILHMRSFTICPLLLLHQQRYPEPQPTIMFSYTHLIESRGLSSLKPFSRTLALSEMYQK